METKRLKEVYKEDAKTSVRNQYIAAIIASLCTFCNGCAVGWVSPSLERLQGTPPPLGAPLTAPQASWVASLLCLGALFATPLFGYLGDTIGRKKAAILIAVPYIICWVLKIACPSVNGLLAARFFAGVGGGGALMISPLYCLEVGNARVRGALGSLAILNINAGILFAYVIGDQLSYHTALWVHLAFPIIYAVGFLFMPETPAFLVKTGKHQEAERAIAWLRNIQPEDTLTKNILVALKEEIALAFQDAKEESLRHFGAMDMQDNRGYQCTEFDSNDIPAWKLFVTDRVTRKTFAVCFTLVSIQGYVGMFAITNFASAIFTDVGASMSPGNSTIVVGGLQFIGSYVSIILIERLGRKPLFISSAALVSVAMASIGTYFSLKTRDYEMTSVSWLPVLALSIAVFSNAFGLGTVPFILTNELFVFQVRGIAASLVIFWLWITAFVVAQSFNFLVNAIGSGGTFWIYSVIALGGAFFCYFFVPETKGKPLEEILQFFNGRRPNGNTYRRDDYEKL